MAAYIDLLPENKHSLVHVLEAEATKLSKQQMNARRHVSLRCSRCCHLTLLCMAINYSSSSRNKNQGRGLECDLSFHTELMIFWHKSRISKQPNLSPAPYKCTLNLAISFSLNTQGTLEGTSIFTLCLISINSNNSNGTREVSGYQSKAKAVSSTIA